MSIRWIIHNKSGNTIRSGWGSNSISFRQNWSKEIRSLQLQHKLNKKLYTLTSKRNENSRFWEYDDFISDSESNLMISRSILKEIGQDIWVLFELLNNGLLNILIINKKIQN